MTTTKLRQQATVATSRALRLLLACALALAFALLPASLIAPQTALAAGSSSGTTYVIDEYGLFNSSQLATLESQAKTLADKYDMGVYLLVVDYMGYYEPTSEERTKFATSYYSKNGLGLGSGKDGIMFVIAADSRDYVTIAYGQGSYSFSDEGIEDMEETVTNYLSENEWYEAADAYYGCMSDQLAYYAENEKPWKPFNIMNALIALLASLGIPGFAAHSMVSSEKAQMQTARERNEASAYLDRATFSLTDQSDRFIRTTIAVTPRPKHEDSDGGGWGGGGGGGFSSSGGGKF